jgi:hypothetical protein
MSPEQNETTNANDVPLNQRLPKPNPAIVSESPDLRRKIMLASKKIKIERKLAIFGRDN